jgi:hypothetical protein
MATAVVVCVVVVFGAQVGKTGTTDGERVAKAKSEGQSGDEGIIRVQRGATCASFSHTYHCFSVCSGGEPLQVPGFSPLQTQDKTIVSDMKWSAEKSEILMQSF